MKVSKKYDDFLNALTKVDFLEGTTAAGKTTVGIFKFMLDVADSPNSQHILAALDVGTIEKNIINRTHGILDEWGPLVEYNGNGTKKDKLPHIVFHCSQGDKTIYVLGYADRARWKKALGNQYGVLYIDEINIADMDFVREAMMRADKVIATLNPDDPELPVYKEYINHSRPLPEYAADEPAEILEALNEEPKPGWAHWFFSFDDNISLTKEKIETIKANVPEGTKQYKNKIEGLRCRATGLIFSNFEYKRNVRNERWVKSQLKKSKRYEGRPGQEPGFKFVLFTAGLDTAYSSESADTISMIFQGITDTGAVITLDEEVINNRDEATPLAPTDTVIRFIRFLDRNRDNWGLARYVYVDSADQATIKELQKYKRANGTIYEFVNAYKKLKIIDRIVLMRGWIQRGDYIVLDHCKNHLKELGTYSYKENGEAEDRNDHTINASQYAWIPYIKKIGMNNDA